MEHENELKEALDFVSPSALTYDEWLMVGMALKDSGLPVTIRRYHIETPQENDS